MSVCSRPVIALALVLVLSPWGHAATTVSARRHGPEPEASPTSDLAAAGEAFLRGVEAFKQGRYDEALAEFSRAQELAPHPDTAFNLGLAQQRADRHVEAWQTFEALLAQARDDQEREDVLAAQAASRPHVAWVRVRVEPAARVVCFDGAPMPRDAQGQLAVLTTPGQHRLDVDRHRRALDLEGGESRTVELSLPPPTAPPASRTTLRVLAGLAIGGAAAAAGAGVGSAIVDDPKQARLGLGIGAAAAGSLAVASSVAALVVHRRARRSTPPPPLDGCPP